MTLLKQTLQVELVILEKNVAYGPCKMDLYNPSTLKLTNMNTTKLCKQILYFMPKYKDITIQIDIPDQNKTQQTLTGFREV